MDPPNLPSSIVNPQLRPSSVNLHSLSDGTLSASLPIDEINTLNMCHILEAPGYLKELILSPPTCTTRFSQMRKEITETLLWFVSQSSDLKRLERVVLPLDFIDGVEAILNMFQHLHRLFHLELVMPTTFIYSSQPENIQRTLVNAIERALEAFSQLEEVIIPAELATGTLTELLDRMFDSEGSSSGGTAFRYYNPGRNLLYGTPVMFLPIS